MSKRVIITRDVKKAASLIAALKSYGIISHAVPVTRVVFDVYKTVPENLKEHNCIAFTSANAVNAFSEILNKSSLKIKRGLRIAAVGPSTAAAAESAFWKPVIIPEKNEAKSLAYAVIAASKDPGKLKVFWPCGKDSLPDFEEVLTGAGASITRWECCRTQALDSEDIRSQLQTLTPWDLVFFAAPSAVEVFSTVWEDKSGFIAVAIGPTTEKALMDAGYENIVISKGTSVTECTGAIVDALKLKVWS